MAAVMVNTFNITQDRIMRSRLAGDPPDIAIDPRIGHIGLAEFDRAAELIDAGAEAVERRLPQIADGLGIFAVRTGVHGSSLIPTK